jgi:hypothetical protein
MCTGPPKEELGNRELRKLGNGESEKPANRERENSGSWEIQEPKYWNGPVQEIAAEPRGRSLSNRPYDDLMGSLRDPYSETLGPRRTNFESAADRYGCAFLPKPRSRTLSPLRQMCHAESHSLTDVFPVSSLRPRTIRPQSVPRVRHGTGVQRFAVRKVNGRSCWHPYWGAPGIVTQGLVFHVSCTNAPSSSIVDRSGEPPRNVIDRLNVPSLRNRSTSALVSVPENDVRPALAPVRSR